MNVLISLAFVGILGALVFAGVTMVRDGRDGKPKTSAMMRALAWRVAISVILFVAVMVAYHMGWIHPTGLPVR